MLKDIVEYLRQTVPNALKEEKLMTMIPWIKDQRIEIIKPPFFAYPEVKIPEKDEELDHEIRERDIEALANAYAFRRIPGRYRSRIKDFFDGQPPPARA
jgi:hypothetical protein